MIRYYVDGMCVTRRLAFRAWRASPTYRRANTRTRDQVIQNAEKGIEDGGTTNHLSEAGIRIALVEDHGEKA